MAIFSGPNLVTDGLILYLDAANTRSYPGSGTTWSDLSSNGTDATLVNNTGLSGGHMSFDGADDYVSVTPASAGTSWTFSAWAQSDVNNSAWHDLWHEESGHRHTMALVTSTGVWMFYDNGYRYSTFTLTDTNWHNYVVTQTGTAVSFYVDGTAYGTSTSAGWQLGGDDAVISRYPVSGGSILEEWDGFIDIIMIHSQPLSAAEVLQNFDAHKGRFGL